MPKSKKGKVSTSFRKEKLTPVQSGKKFKRTKKLQKKMRKSICDSTFSMSYLSPSNVSTPVGSRGTVGKRKACRVSVGDTSVVLSGVLEDIKGDTPIEETVEPPSKKVRIVGPPDATGNVVKDIGNMFRNDHHVMTAPIIEKPAVSQSVMGEKDGDASIIVIDDDDDNASTSAVEELGQELIKLVEEPVLVVPDTPRTVIKKLLSPEVIGDNNTIVIDDTGDDDDPIIIENNDWPPLPTPLQTGNLQGVLTRYPSRAPDFIPLGRGGRGNRRGRGNNKKGRGGIEKVKGKHMRHVPNPLFTIGPSTTQFTDINDSGKSGVFRFTGNKEVKDKEGPTMYVGDQDDKVRGELRPIVIDGSNVAMGHGLDSVFSSKGIDLIIKYFINRGHQKVVAFVPQFRNKFSMSTDRELLEQLYKSGKLVYTPSREVGGTRITSYDDAFILDYAAMHGGVVVTRDNYRDLAHEKPEWLEVVRNRILVPTFVGDDIMFPSDPLGRSGPSLDSFLKF